MARARKSIQVDKGVSIYRPPGCPVWHICIIRHGVRTRETLDTQVQDDAIVIARQRADELVGQTSGVVLPRDHPFEEIKRVYDDHAKNRLSDISVRNVLIRLNQGWF